MSQQKLIINDDLEIWIRAAHKYSDKLLERNSDSSCNLFDLEELYNKINDNLHHANDKQLIQMCDAMYVFCEITNNWSYWFSWANRISRIDGSGYEGLLYYGMGRFYEEIDDLEASRKCHFKGITFSKKINKNEKWLALNCQGIGIVLFRLNIDTSIKYLEIAYKIFKNKKEAYFWGCVCSEIGGFYYRRKIYFLDKKKFLNKVLQVQLGVENTIESVFFYRKAILIHSLMKYPWDLDRFFYSLGSTWLESKLFFVKAFFSFCSSMKRAKENKSIRYIALSFYGLGRFLYKIRNYNKALEYLHEADILYHDYFSTFKYYSENEFNISLMICFTYLRLNEIEKAIKYYSNLEEHLKKNMVEKIRTPNLVNQCTSLLYLARELEITESITFWQKKINGLS